MDGRSSDRTLETLRDAGADVQVFTPRGDVVEAGMIEFGALAARSAWTLRLDDDEFPSRALLQWINALDLSSTDAPAYAIPRRELRLLDDRLVYSTWPTLFANLKGRSILNPQWRFFRPDGVTYISELHTPGFRVPDDFRLAPDDCFIAHFDQIIRSPSSRLEKLRKYCELDEGRSWRFAHISLPELIGPTSRYVECAGIEEFESIVERLPKVENGVAPPLSQKEIRALIACTEDILANQIEFERSTRREKEHLLSAFLVALSLIPLSALKWMAELFLTIGRLCRSTRLGDIGASLWTIYKSAAETELK